MKPARHLRKLNGNNQNIDQPIFMHFSKMSNTIFSIKK